MPKIVLTVEIDLNMRSVAIAEAVMKDIAQRDDDWFPIEGEPDQISVDDGAIRVDPTEDSFRLFRFKNVRVEV